MASLQKFRAEKLYRLRTTKAKKSYLSYDLKPSLKGFRHSITTKQNRGKEFLYREDVP